MIFLFLTFFLPKIFFFETTPTLKPAKSNLSDESIKTSAPNDFANDSFFALISAAIILLAPAAFAPIIADNPTPPSPITRCPPQSFCGHEIGFS